MLSSADCYGNCACTFVFPISAPENKNKGRKALFNDLVIVWFDIFSKFRVKLYLLTLCIAGCNALIYTATSIIGAIQISFLLFARKCNNWLCASSETFKECSPPTP